MDYLAIGVVFHSVLHYRLRLFSGAEAPTYLALLPPHVKEPRGQFVWKDKTVVSWVEPLKERF